MVEKTKMNYSKKTKMKEEGAVLFVLNCTFIMFIL